MNNYINDCQKDSSDKDTAICNFLRFPLMCGVVFIHARFNVSSISIATSGTLQFCVSELYDSISTIISSIICSVCVPLFYFISGFLFFYATHFDCNTFFNKLKRRFHSLLIPYIFWNALVLLFYLAAQSIIPSMVGSKSFPLNNFTLLDIIKSFWEVSPDRGASMPIAAQFWFIRNLMVTILFSPIIYWCIKKLDFLFILFFMYIWFSGTYPHIPGFGDKSFFFFTCGAYFSIKNISFSRKFSRYTKYLAILWVITLISVCLCMDCVFLKKIYIIIALPTIIGFFSLKPCLLNFISKHKNLSKCSFFMFAYHYLPLVLLDRLLLKVFPTHNDVTFLLIYFIPPIIIIVLGYVLYVQLSKYFPRFTAFVSGGR